MRRNRKKGIGLWLMCMAFAGCLILGGCGTQTVETDPEAVQEHTMEAKTPKIGLILASQDDPQNEALILQFEELSEELGAELRVCIPEVTCEEAKEARALDNDFILCDVDPVEYQMLFMNELVEDGVDVVAICANHPQGLEPVLTAARGIGIRICAIGWEVGEESCDAQTSVDDAAECVQELLQEM